MQDGKAANILDGGNGYDKLIYSGKYSIYSNYDTAYNQWGFKSIVDIKNIEVLDLSLIKGSFSVAPNDVLKITKGSDFSRINIGNGNYGSGSVLFLENTDFSVINYNDWNYLSLASYSDKIWKVYSDFSNKTNALLLVESEFSNFNKYNTFDLEFNFGSSISDINNDGWYEPFGYINIDGILTNVDLSTLNLNDLIGSERIGSHQIYNGETGWVNRDFRVFDYNNDFISDLITTTYTTYKNDYYSLLMKGLGTGYQKEANFDKLFTSGYGETIILIDYDNNNLIDILITYYQISNEPGTMLFKNMGNSGFKNVTLDANFNNLRLLDSPIRPEGAFSFDLNNDGWVDLYYGGKIFSNLNGNGFQDVTTQSKITPFFDEGAQLIDFDNDGDNDILVQRPDQGGLILFENNGGKFATKTNAFDKVANGVWGFNVTDINGDGYDDIVMMGGGEKNPIIYINNLNNKFLYLGTNPLQATSNPNHLNPYQYASGSAPSVADFDRDGMQDLFFPGTWNTGNSTSYSPYYAINSNLPQYGAISVELLHDGYRNMYGHHVFLQSMNDETLIRTRTFDGGSAYAQQSSYSQTITFADNSLYELTFSKIITSENNQYSAIVSSGWDISVDYTNLNITTNYTANDLIISSNGNRNRILYLSEFDDTVYCSNTSQNILYVSNGNDIINCGVASDNITITNKNINGYTEIYNFNSRYDRLFLGDGYEVSGNKIFNTSGSHDIAIVELVGTSSIPDSSVIYI